jgi:hypothetical protein
VPLCMESSSDGGALDRSVVKGRVRSDPQKIEQVPARNAGGYREPTARVGAQKFRYALNGLRSGGREPGR